MRKKSLKAEASFNYVVIAGWKNKEVEDYINMVETDLKLMAKRLKLKITGFVEVIDVK